MGNPFVFGTGPWDPSRRFVTSWAVGPFVLFAVRALFAFYAFFTALFILGFKCADAAGGGCKQAQDEFSFFTVLTYWGLAFYFGLAALHTFTYARTGTPLLDRFPRPLQALHSLLYTTIVTYPFLVTAVYWGVLYSGPGAFPRVFDAWSNISRHALNSVMALFELAVPRTERPPWIHLLWLIVIEALYLAVTYITHATKGFYVYSFLDPGTKGQKMVVAYVFGIAVAVIVIFLLIQGLIALRMWVLETKLGLNGKFARKGPWRNDTETAALEKERPLS